MGCLPTKPFLSPPPPMASLRPSPLWPTRSQSSLTWKLKYPQPPRTGETEGGHVLRQRCVQEAPLSSDLPFRG